MKWAHLPVAGGLYDQHPDLLDKWEIIFQKRAALEARKAEEEKRKNKANSRGGARVAGRR